MQDPRQEIEEIEEIYEVTKKLICHDEPSDFIINNSTGIGGYTSGLTVILKIFEKYYEICDRPLE